MDTQETIQEILFDGAVNAQDRNAPTCKSLLEAMLALDTLLSSMQDKELASKIDLLAGSLQYRAERNGFALGLEAAR